MAQYALKFKFNLKQVIRRLLAFCVSLSLILVSICMLAYLIISYKAAPYIFHNLQDLETITPTKIMVLGAKVYADGRVSPLLQQRLDKAKEAYFYLQEQAKNKQKLNCAACEPEQKELAKQSQQADIKIILSGGKLGPYDEPMAMANYLKACGIALNALILDKAGVNTYHSCRNYLAKYPNEQVLIVTSDYHLERSCYLARHLNIKAYGLAANSRNFGLSTQLYNFFREALSRVKALINVYVNANFAN